MHLERSVIAFFSSAEGVVSPLTSKGMSMRRAAVLNEHRSAETKLTTAASAITSNASYGSIISNSSRLPAAGAPEGFKLFAGLSGSAVAHSSKRAGFSRRGEYRKVTA